MFRHITEEVWPDEPPKVPRDVNPTGAYVRRIDVPETWSDRRVFLRFEGVTGGYFVLVNGEYVGYDQGGYTQPAVVRADHDVPHRRARHHHPAAPRGP